MADKTDRIIPAFFHPPHQPTFIGATSISLFLPEVSLLLILIITGVETSGISPFDGGAISSSISEIRPSFLFPPLLHCLHLLLGRMPTHHLGSGEQEREPLRHLFIPFHFNGPTRREVLFRTRLERLNMVLYDQSLEPKKHELLSSLQNRRC